jgi:hypothetical protein
MKAIILDSKKTCSELKTYKAQMYGGFGPIK